MSETQTEAPALQDGAQAPVETVVQQPAVETQATEDTGQEIVREAEQSADPAKPKGGDRRFANMTARLVAEAEGRRQAEARADAAEQLLRAGRTEDDGAQQPPVRQITQADIRAEAARLNAEEKAEAVRLGVVARGIKEFGQEGWIEKTGILDSLGATRNPAFLAAIMETENAPRLVAALADDTDMLMEILAKSPAAMAAHLGRMDAKIGASPAPRSSNAPTPPRKIAAVSTPAEPDLYNYDPGMSMEAWNRMADKLLPEHLGGKRKPG
jgi:hypothetical protein